MSNDFIMTMRTLFILKKLGLKSTSAEALLKLKARYQWLEYKKLNRWRHK